VESHERMDEATEAPKEPTQAVPENTDLVEVGNLGMEMENITDYVRKLTEGHVDPNQAWLRKWEDELPNGVSIYYAYTVERQEGNYAAIVENMPRIGRIITRRWNNLNAADKNQQEVTVRTLQTDGRYKPGEPQRGFTRKDINRMNKLIKDTLEHIEADG
jgi:hypothetical protein